MPVPAISHSGPEYGQGILGNKFKKKSILFGGKDKLILSYQYTGSNKFTA